MIRLFHFLFVLFFTSIAVAASPTDNSATESRYEHTSLHELMKNIDEASIHNALHLLSDKFRHGVFPTDTNAIEALHKEDASLADRLLKFAKRQTHADNSTSSSTPPLPTTSESTPSSSQVPSSTPEPTTPETTTTPELRLVLLLLTRLLLRRINPETTSSPSPSPSTSESPTPSPTTFSTFSTSNKPTTTTPSKTTKTSDSGSEPFTSTYESTTTLANGSLSTVTAVTVIHPSSHTTSASPGLQTGAASTTASLTKEIIAIVGGAVAVAMAL
ncbi:hypothetical protein PHISCL_00871 [Aspergillus sclerotialis]|uniref:GPI anchored protein n=1 Tax=Aspergillus sclerotialis TaxID=2070753 RepID=A0A3A2ZUV9_9EURO|nr:hypothetical protein PHISCL_00871 [Aspergillus sclerotialis]